MCASMSVCMYFSGCAVQFISGTAYSKDFPKTLPYNLSFNQLWKSLDYVSGHLLQRKQAHALSGPSVWMISSNPRTSAFPKGQTSLPSVLLKVRSAAVDRVTRPALPSLL